jgi:hypothetical protein
MANHRCKAGSFEYSSDSTPIAQDVRRHVQPWLSAVYQSEHLGILVGNGLTIAIAGAAGHRLAGMGRVQLGSEFDKALEAYAVDSAERLGRGVANIEDQIRAANQLIQGLRIIAADKAPVLESALSAALRTLLTDVLQAEGTIRSEIESGTAEGLTAKRLLTSFLMSFANRAASRERLNIFTTNYDRLIEYGCDLTGLRSLDRFVGTLTPVFRASRVDVDLHYNPPGIRGEPRYLDGVVQITKLHGSLDWKNENGLIRRFAIPFGSTASHPDLPSALEQIIIYPNASKDIETAEYPYAELFRDCSAALCRPNSALITYGYGFGDDHINRILRDMLALPSTHLVIISYDDPGGRITRFCEEAGRVSQISFMIGSHFADLENLTKHYLPQSSADPLLHRARSIMAEQQSEVRADALVEEQPTTSSQNQVIE